MPHLWIELGLGAFFIGLIMIPIFGCALHAEKKWRWFWLILLGIALAISGLAVVINGETYQHYQCDYQDNVSALKADVRQYRADQKDLKREGQRLRNDRAKLHQMSANNLHDPKIASMRASQAQDYFVKRRRLQKRVKYAYSSYNEDRPFIKWDRNSVNGDIRSAHRDARYPHVRTYHWSRIHWAEKQLKR